MKKKTVRSKAISLNALEKDEKENLRDWLLDIDLLKCNNPPFYRLPCSRALTNAYNSKPGSAKWNLNADLDNNGAVGLTDLVMLALHYGQHNP